MRPGSAEAWEFAGRELCCSSFLQSLDTVSVKMAKEQNMLLNPEKISGIVRQAECVAWPSSTKATAI